MYADLCASVWALSALRVAADCDLIAALATGQSDVAALARTSGLDPEATERILLVLAANDIVARAASGGFTLTEEGVQLASRGPGLRADLAVTFGQTRALVEEARRGALPPGWRHVDPEVIRAQAGLSAEATERSFPTLTSAWPAFSSVFSREGARVIDVGSGGAGGAIALCKQFPSLRVVGLDPHRAAMLEARAAVSAAGLGHRIELRRERVQDLADERAFDAAFVAAKFFDDTTLASGLERIRRALVPGGAALLVAWRDPGEPKRAAASRLREHLWGGGARPASDVVRMLEAAGFVDVRMGPVRGDIALVGAQAPSA
jgi:SAM-dependent methyltransferase